MQDYSQIDIIINCEMQFFSNDIKAYWNQFLVIRNNVEASLPIPTPLPKRQSNYFHFRFQESKIYSEAGQPIKIQ